LVRLVSFVFALLLFPALSLQAQPPADPLVVLDCDSPPEGFGCASVRGGTATFAITSAPSTFNPVTTEDVPSGQINDRLFGASGVSDGYGFLAAGAQGTVPQAASVIEVSEDATAVTYTLRAGLKFSDGSPASVEDVAYWYYNVVWNPFIPNSFQSGVCTDGTPFRYELLAEDQLRVSCPETFRTFTAFATPFVMSRAMALELIEAQGIATANVISPGPDGLLQSEPAGDDAVFGPNVSPGEDGVLQTQPAGDDAVAAVPTAEFLGLSAPVELFRGFGPFVLESFDSQALARYARNPHFYEVDSNGTQLPYLDEYQAIIIPTQGDNLRLSQFLNGTVDWIPPNEQDIAVILSQAAAGGFQVNQAINANVPNSGELFMTPNFDDPNPNVAAAVRRAQVRRALSLATDRTAMINNVRLGIGTPQYNQVSLDQDSFYVGRDNTCADFVAAGLAEADACVNGTWTLNNGSELSIAQLPNPDDPRHRQWLSCLDDSEGCLETARRLLDEVGIIDTDGDGVREVPANFDPVVGNPGGPLELQIVSSSGIVVTEESAKVACDGWNRIGVACNAATTAFPTLVQQLLTGSFTGFIAIALTGGDPAGGTNVWPCGQALHFWHLSCDPSAPAGDPAAPTEADLAIESTWREGLAATSVADAQAAFDAFQRAFAEHEPFIHLTVGNGLFAERVDRVANTGGSNSGNDDLKFRCDLPGQAPNCADAPHQP